MAAGSLPRYLYLNKHCCICLGILGYKIVPPLTASLTLPPATKPTRPPPPPPLESFNPILRDSPVFQRSHWHCPTRLCLTSIYRLGPPASCSQHALPYLDTLIVLPACCTTTTTTTARRYLTESGDGHTHPPPKHTHLHVSTRLLPPHAHLILPAFAPG